MSDQVKVLAPVIWSEIQKANKILLHCHPGPDGDSVGGVLAMKHALESLGKKVTVIWGDSTPPAYLSRLPGFSSIESKNYFQIDPVDFDLFIIQDSGSLDQISKKGEIIFPESLTTIVIDHHATNPKFAKINLVEASYPAICQIIYDLFSIWSIEITSDIALCLFMGLYTDTGGFKYPGVSADTFIVAANLVKTGADLPKMIFEMENSNDFKAIEYMGAFFSSIEHYFNGNVAICSLTTEQLEKLGINKNMDVPDLVGSIKSCIGNNIAISLTEKTPNEIRVSMRTRDQVKYDVAKIAVATGSGGGHPTAAGATIKLSMPEAKKFLLDTIQKVYPELGRP